ncbi:hypothetical protein NEAUS03_0220 [Nematocida ausubeli]|nr:hypothetical protein NEAUS03_0220 [Nematocida ausubeli]
MNLPDTRETNACQNIIVAQIEAIKRQAENPDEMTKRLSIFCPHVNLEKYSRVYSYNKCIQGIESFVCPSDAKNSKKYPLCIALIEENILYSEEKKRESLGLITEVIKMEVRGEDLLYLHRLLANALSSSFKFEYSEEYDRWLILAVIKIAEIEKKEEYCLEYFPGVVDRISKGGSSFRDRAIILSEFLTDGILSYDSPESAYFSHDIPSNPIVQEEDESPEEDVDMPGCITTLTEYYFTVKDSNFENEPSEKIEATLHQLPRILRTEKISLIKKYFLELLKIHVAIETKKSIDGICAILLVDDLAYEVMHLLYGNSGYSLHFKRTIIGCLRMICPRIRTDVAVRIAQRYCSTSYSEEETKMGADALFKQILSAHSI